MEWVQEEINGKVVPIRDADSLAKAMCDLLGDPNKRERFNKLNRKLIENKADRNVVMKGAEGLYRSLIAERAGPAAV
jgi:glycosyltransferase involved in cell wall biosynthesis